MLIQSVYVILYYILSLYAHVYTYETFTHVYDLALEMRGKKIKKRVAARRWNSFKKVYFLRFVAKRIFI